MSYSKTVKTNYAFANKWTPRIAQKGYAALPNLLIEHQADLGITPSEMAVVIGLLAKKWSKSNPYPSVKTLSRQSGLAANTVRNQLRRLERKGLIKRQFRQGASSEYDFAPMVERLESYTQSKQTPTQKRIPPRSDMSSPPYSNSDTKEDPFKKTKERRRSGNGGKLESLGEIMATRQDDPP